MTEFISGIIALWLALGGTMLLVVLIERDFATRSIEKVTVGIIASLLVSAICFSFVAGFGSEQRFISVIAQEVASIEMPN